MTEQLDIDLLNAILLFLRGESPKGDCMEEWEYNAMAFTEANDISQFFSTEEYQLATLIGTRDDMNWFHFFEVTL